MAFTKKVSARGVEAAYFKIIGFRWDVQEREASALFALYVDKAHADRSKPTVPAARRDRPLIDIAAKLRLYGDAFDQYLGPDVMADGVATAGTDVLAHLYAAAKDASKAVKPKDGRDPIMHIVSDFGADVFADARAV
jgi:hypothetical protein